MTMMHNDTDGNHMITKTVHDDANACKSGFHGFEVSVRSFEMMCE